jgi:AcrR family transcriptional regulator
MMVEAQADRRVRRTRQLLIDALLALIVERGYEALTVQDILDRADVGRSTFYAHFREKDDLLQAAFGRLRGVLEGQTRGPATSLPEVSLELFRHTAEHRPLYQAMVGRPSGSMLNRAIHDLLSVYVRAHFERLADRLPVPVEVAAQYYVSALLGLLTWWLDGERPYSAAEMDLMFRQLVLPMLEHKQTQAGAA